MRILAAALLQQLNTSLEVSFVSRIMKHRRKTKGELSRYPIKFLPLIASPSSADFFT